MLIIRLSVFLLSLFFVNFSNANIQSSGTICKNFPNISPKTGPLMQMNCDFNNLYAYRINMLKNSLGAPNGRPVILNLKGRLIFKYNGQTQVVNIIPDPYPQLKAFGHGVFSIFLLLSMHNSGELYKGNKVDLVRIVRTMEESKQSLREVAPAVMKDVNYIVRETKSFVSKVLAENSWRKEDLNKYYSKIKSKQKNIFKYAAMIEINALDRALNVWLVGIPKSEQAKIGIVVAVDHQSRAREITVNYFAKRFNKLICEGALCEDGLVVLEDKTDVNSALELLARHYLNQQAGGVIFGDVRRLQFDIFAM